MMRIKSKVGLRVLAGALLWLLAVGALAAQDKIKIGELYYYLYETSKTAVVTSGSTKYSGDIVIPESVTYSSRTYAVTSIGYKAFYDCTGLTSIEIPGSVITISESAFHGCTGLTSIEIPNSVTEIGASAFSGCTGLTSIEIPNSVTKIDEYAFSGCTGLTQVTIADRGTALYYDRDVFESCLIRTLYLGGKISYCWGGSYSPLFSGLTTLETLTIGDSVTSIGWKAFCGCTGLTSIEFPNSVTSIGEYAFSDCTGLTSIEFPNSVTSIGEYAFYDCTGLTEVTIADRGTALYCPSSVFKSSAIQSLYLGGNIDGGFCGPTLETVTIGDSVTSIGEYAFSGCTGLTSIEIPNSVTSIGSSAFRSCSGLTSIEIPNSVTEIASYTFASCTGLQTVVLGKSLTHIREKSFWGCEHLMSLTSKADVPAECAADAFQNVPVMCELFVPEASVELYKIAPVWKDFLRVTGKDLCDRIYVTALRLEPDGASLRVGEGLPLRAVVTPDSATEQTVVWESSDKNVLRVDNDGYVMAVAAGEAVITARTTDGTDISASCMVTVAAADSGDDGPGGGEGGDDDKILVETLSVSTGGAATELQAGGTLQLRAVVTPSNATNKAVAWSSSDKKVATVDNDGYVVALAAGTVVITARTTDGTDISATCALTVTAAGSGGDGGDDDDDKILVKTITVSTGGASTELQAGGTLQLSAVITPSNATNKTVTWSSSNKKVATVDNDGYVVALAAGTVVITARTTDGSDLSATCNLKVVGGSGGGNTAVEVPDALQAVRVYADGGRIEVRGLPLGTAVTLSGVDGRLWYQAEAVTGPELSLVAPRGHVYVLRLNHTHSLKVYLP